MADAEWGPPLYLPFTLFLCFLLGATVGGVCIRYDTFYLGRAYGRSLIFIALLIGMALVIDRVHRPGANSHHYYIYMCAVAAGMCHFLLLSSVDSAPRRSLRPSLSSLSSSSSLTTTA